MEGCRIYGRRDESTYIDFRSFDGEWESKFTSIILFVFDVTFVCSPATQITLSHNNKMIIISPFIKGVMSTYRKDEMRISFLNIFSCLHVFFPPILASFCKNQGHLHPYLQFSFPNYSLRRIPQLRRVEYLYYFRVSFSSTFHCPVLRPFGSKLDSL